jgi:MFS family permease
LAVGLAQTVSNLGRSLVMNDLGFSATAISSTGAIGALCTLPLPILVGWLSDRAGRVQLLVLGYLACTTALLVLAVSASLWHFWLVLGVMNVLFATGSVGSALATDLVPQESLGRGMSLLSTMGWVGSIIGYAGTGYAVQNLGTASTFRAGALLPLLAIGLVMSIRPAGQEREVILPQPITASPAEA